MGAPDSPQALDDHALRHDGDRSRFDLRQVENVGDQIEQVGPGAVNGAGELDLFRREIAFGVVAQLLAQDQDAVERSPELVRHVGEEFRLVLGGQGQLARFLLERAASLLDLLVLPLHLLVLLGQLLCLLGQLLVGLLQLPLLGLQLGRQLLRLLEQRLGLHRGLDTVQHDADTGGELLQEGEVGSGKSAERRQARSRPSHRPRTTPAGR
jgi:hypothetical protein